LSRHGCQLPSSGNTGKRLSIGFKCTSPADLVADIYVHLRKKIAAHLITNYTGIAFLITAPLSLVFSNLFQVFQPNSPLPVLRTRRYDADTRTSQHLLPLVARPWILNKTQLAFKLASQAHGSTRSNSTNSSRGHRYQETHRFLQASARYPASISFRYVDAGIHRRHLFDLKSNPFMLCLRR
jgi:hypothetical protein